MREAKEGERFRLPFSALLPVSGREPSELQKSRFDLLWAFALIIAGAAALVV
jgi:hypothetical protein